MKKFQEKSRLLSNYLCPMDRRIQNFIDEFSKGTELEGKIKIPASTLHLDRHGQARGLSLPPNKNKFQSKHLSSYRLLQGVLHNPSSDRRTTKNTFHVADYNLPIPSDKLIIPKNSFTKLLYHAFNPPEELLEIPFTEGEKEKAKAFVSLFLRPLVSPEVEGVSQKKSMEIRFFCSRWIC